MALNQVKYGKPIGDWELDVSRTSEVLVSYDNLFFRRMPIGSFVAEGKHTPFRALACPLHLITTVSEESPLDSAQSRRARRT